MTPASGSPRAPAGRPPRFVDKVVVVTGAAQGIGRGVAEGVAAEGGAALCVDRSKHIGETVAAIAAAGGTASGLEADLETFAGAEAMVEAALRRWGRIDILVNNVGGTIWTKPYHRYAPEEIEREIRRSLFTTLWCCRAALPHMVERKAGVIVNVSSIATRSIHRAPYAAAKGGVNALTASLAMEHAGAGIRVVATAPGGTEAPPRKVARHPGGETEEEKAWYRAIVEQTEASSLMHRYGTIAEQVAPILFLASDEASYVTGSVLPVGGGDLG
ncbi:1,2-dihydroxycyclohexa-3,5-diene-1-carboxylate dehydrogenase [Roseiarcus fermentans]|uniref:1,2-dihydroxycyclohexa-3,5-diene-1-carboxylate dehydrogenase n=1 Tax=Roseiarcus fermentans TaxID=1473586 RepID=A0A366EL50_9HYPH|nr:benzoate diol dehydrogenase BenD [Roseiarcus fermentans]RBP03054.1 1,2-dihydroxycyclohexa-3,5-diene-1-carboxylate dehydrogenase [Roseiarcus fermentans]